MSCFSLKAQQNQFSQNEAKSCLGQSIYINWMGWMRVHLLNKVKHQSLILISSLISYKMLIYLWGCVGYQLRRYVCMCVYICMCMYVCMYVYLRMCVYVCLCVCVYIYMYIYMNSFIPNDFYTCLKSIDQKNFI